MKSQTRLSNFTFTFDFHALEKEIATHSTVLAWRIPGTGEPGGLPVCGVAQSRTRLKRLSSSSSRLCCRCCCCSVTKLCPAVSDPMDYSMPGYSVVNSSQSWFKFMSIDLVMLSNHLILCCLLPLPPSIFPSIKIFSNEAAPHISQPKYWSFPFSISPSNGLSGLKSFRMD